MRSNPNVNQFSIYHQNPKMPMGSWKKAWTTARRKAGVRVRFHDLRHTVVSRLLDAGCTLEQIAPLLGWSAKTMVEMMKIYQHRSLENRRKTMLNLVTPGSRVDELNQLVTLLHCNKSDPTLMSAVATIINKMIENLT